MLGMYNDLVVLILYVFYGFLWIVWSRILWRNDIDQIFIYFEKSEFFLVFQILRNVHVLKVLIWCKGVMRIRHMLRSWPKHSIPIWSSCPNTDWKRPKEFVCSKNLLPIPSWVDTKFWFEMFPFCFQKFNCSFVLHN